MRSWLEEALEHARGRLGRTAEQGELTSEGRLAVRKYGEYDHEAAGEADEWVDARLCWTCRAMGMKAASFVLTAGAAKC